MTTIQDQNFPLPNTINQHPCLAANRWLNLIPESVDITEICQDPNNTSLIKLRIVLVGTYNFEPTLRILSVDGDTSYETNNIVGIFAEGHRDNPNRPINTRCQTYNGTLVYDIGSLINNYLSAQNIVFRLDMLGTIPLQLGVNIPSQSCSSTYSWSKGVLPSPIGLKYSNDILQVLFEYKGNTNCNCNINCVIPTGLTKQISFCPGETQSLLLSQSSSSTDPYSVLIQLSDTLGNLSSLSFQSLFTTKPKPPTVTVGTKPKRIEIGIHRESINGISVDDKAMYRILRYKGNKSNYIIWKDWSDINWNHFIDYDVIPGEKYGYSVSFKGLFGEVSKFSDWTEVTV